MYDIGNLFEDEFIDYDSLDLPKDFYKTFWRLTTAGKDLVYTVLICKVSIDDYCKMRGISLRNIGRTIFTIRQEIMNDKKR